MSQPVTIEPVTSGRATIKTTAGDVVIEFWPKESKLAVRNFVQLALEGYYDGCIFHRVVPGLCVQSGDASNSGHGGESIYDSEPFADEFSQRLRFNRRGLIACANAGTRNSNLSQFFITLDKADNLNGKHTIFATVRGDTYFNVVKISEGELQPDSDRPVYPIVIKSIEIDDNPFPDIEPRITAAEKREQEKAKREARKNAAARKGKKEGVKNKSLMSFGDEEEVTSVPATSSKLASAHEALTDDPTLRAESLEVRGLPARMPEGFGELPGRESSKKRKADDLHDEASQQGAGAAFSAAGFSSQVNGASASTNGLERFIGKKARATATSIENDYDANARVKAEIAKVQADLKKLVRKGRDASDGEEEQPKDKKKSKHSGAALLAAAREQYKRGGRSIGKGSDDMMQTGGRRRREDDDDVVAALEGFRSKLRTALPEEAEIEASNGAAENGEIVVEGYAGEILEGDDDDSGWMGHKLKFRKDATAERANADDYEIIDPRTQNMTLEDAKRHESRLKRQTGMNNGAIARAGRNIERGNDEAPRNRANDYDRGGRGDRRDEKRDDRGDHRRDDRRSFGRR